MLRTALLRNELLKETLKKSLRINTARTLSVECTKRRHRNNNQPCLLKSAQKAQWKYETVRFYADLPPHQKVTLPALSPTMETGTIVSWEKKEGDKLNEGDLLAEIETDKATMGFETPEEGYLAKILIPAGSKNVPIGKLVCIIVQNQNDVAAFKNFKDDGSAAAAPPAKPAAAGAPAPPPPSPGAPPPPPAPPASSASPPPPAAASGGRVYVSPMAKRLAEQRQIRLEGVKGTGLYGSITSKDLPAGGAAAPAAAAAPKGASKAAKIPVKSGAAFTDTPISSMRSTIAKRLTQSKQTIPHYYLTTEVTVDELLALRARFNEMLQKEKIKLSINDFLIKAMAITQRKLPLANSIWMDTVIREFHSVDVSVAVSTDKGLITPIVFNADSKGVIEISKEIKELAAKARANKLQPHEFQGGTITISNVGMFGVNQIAPIVNPPQSLILGVGKTTKKLVLDDHSEKGFKQSEILVVTASCDHRILDGAVGAKWLATFKDLVEDPAKMIL